MHVHHHVPVVGRHLEQQVVAQDAGVVDEDGRRAELVGNAGDGALDALLVGDIAADGQGVAAGGLDGLDRCRASGFVEVEDGDLHAVRSEALGDGGADAARGSGDDGGSLGHGEVLSWSGGSFRFRGSSTRVHVHANSDGQQ